MHKSNIMAMRWGEVRRRAMEGSAQQSVIRNRVRKCKIYNRNWHNFSLSLLIYLFICTRAKGRWCFANNYNDDIINVAYSSFSLQNFCLANGSLLPRREEKRSVAEIVLQTGIKIYKANKIRMELKLWFCRVMWKVLVIVDDLVVALQLQTWLIIYILLL